MLAVYRPNRFVTWPVVSVVTVEMCHVVARTGNVQQYLYLFKYSSCKLSVIGTSFRDNTPRKREQRKQMYKWHRRSREDSADCLFGQLNVVNIFPTNIGDKSGLNGRASPRIGFETYKRKDYFLWDRFIVFNVRNQVNLDQQCKRNGMSTH